jgi:hypothetical protein
MGGKMMADSNIGSELQQYIRIEKFLKNKSERELKDILVDTIDELCKHGLLCHDDENNAFYWDDTGESLDAFL